MLPVMVSEVQTADTSESCLDCCLSRKHKTYDGTKKVLDILNIFQFIGHC